MLLTATHYARVAARLGIPAALLGLLAAACGGADSEAFNSAQPYYADDPSATPDQQTPMSAEQKTKVKLLREAIDLGLGFGKTTLGDELNVELGQAGITKRYEPTTVSGRGYVKPATPICPFLSPSPSGENVDCRAIVTRATVSAYARTTAIQSANPLDNRFDSIRTEGEFWYSEGFATGIDNEATAALYEIRSLKLCDQAPQPSQSAYDAGVERGRLLYTEQVNNRLAETGHSMHYPDQITQIQQCNADTSLLAPARVRALDDAAAYAKANPLCSDYDPSTKEDIARLDDAEKQFLAGMKQGIEAESSLAGELIFKVVPCNVGDPLVLDLDGDGVSVVPMAQSKARFDMFGTGTPTAIAWVTGDDALLAIDRNGNGTIDSGRELFGNFVGDRGFEELSSGFAHLALSDQPCNGGDDDGMITAADAIFSRLVLWQDTNGNGVSEPGELHSLASMGVTSISLASTAVSHGPITHRSSFSRASWAANLAGSSAGQIVDVWFDHGRTRAW
ncbi:MAG: hypothetical protein HY898_08265 [Deltaproteobacteria bacterium]|nr:hypothetical protein [Deltaproteobacteria bacterium]